MLSWAIVHTFQCKMWFWRLDVFAFWFLFTRRDHWLVYVFQRLIVVPEVDVEATNIFFDLTNSHTQLMNTNVPWRDGRVKDSKSLKYLLMSSLNPKAMVLDAYAPTYDKLLNAKHLYLNLCFTMYLLAYLFVGFRCFFSCLWCGGRHLVESKPLCPICEILLLSWLWRCISHYLSCQWQQAYS